MLFLLLCRDQFLLLCLFPAVFDSSAQLFSFTAVTLTHFQSALFFHFMIVILLCLFILLFYSYNVTVLFSHFLLSYFYILLICSAVTCYSIFRQTVFAVLSQPFTVCSILTIVLFCSELGSFLLFRSGLFSFEKVIFGCFVSDHFVVTCLTFIDQPI